MFFIYLAMNTMLQKNNFVKQGIVTPLSAKQNSAAQLFINPNSYLRGVQSFLPDFLTIIAEQLLVIGLMLGGMYAANQLGIKGASAGIGAVKSVTGSLGRYVGRRAGKIATYPLRTQTGQKIASNLQTSTSMSARIGRAIGVGTLLGRGMQRAATAGGAGAVTAAKNRQKNVTTEELINRLPSMLNAADRVAAIQRIKDEGKLREVKNIDKYLGQDKENLYKSYGADKMFNEARNESGVKLRELMEEQEKAIANNITTWSKEINGQLVRPIKEVGEEIEKHFRSAPNAGKLAEMFFPSDDQLAKMIKEGNLPAGVKDGAQFTAMQETIVRNSAKGFSPQNMSAFLQQLTKGDQLDLFEKIAGKVIKSEDDVNDRIKNWLDSSGARNLGISRKTFNLSVTPRNNTQTTPPNP